MNSLRYTCAFTLLLSMGWNAMAQVEPTASPTSNEVLATRAEDATPFEASRGGAWRAALALSHGGPIQTAPTALGSQPEVKLKPVVMGPIVVKQKRIRARVHQSGEWELLVKRSESEESLKALQTRQANDENGGTLEFDLGSLESESITALKELNGDGAPELAPGMVILTRQRNYPANESAAVPVTVNKVQVFLQPPKEGDQVVKGEVIGVADQVRVEVFNANRTLADLDTAAIESAPSDKQSGKGFTAGMNRHLAAGQSVRVVALKDGEEIGASADYTLVETIGFDWGRVRAYFTLGGTLAVRETQTRNDVDEVTSVKREMDSADYYVAFNADYNWFSTLRDRHAFSCLRPASAQEDLRQLQDLVDKWDSVKDLRKHIGSIPTGSRTAQEDFQVRQRVVRAVQSVTGEFQNVLGASIASLEAFQSGNGCSEMERARVRMLKDFQNRYALTLLGLIELNHLRVTSFQTFAEGMKHKNVNPPMMRSVADTTEDARMISLFLTQEENIGAALTEDDRNALIAEIASLNRDLDRALELYEESDPANVPGGFLFNTSFEGRLAQAPATGVDEDAPNALTVFQNANTFYAGVDAYAPFIFERAAWRFNGVENALFVAPLARFSMLALPSGPVADEKNLIRDLYLSHSYGARFGFLEYAPRRKTVAPELISFLDLTVGKFDNFRRPVAPPPDDPTKNFEVPWRVEASGAFPDTADAPLHRLFRKLWPPF